MECLEQHISPKNLTEMENRFYLSNPHTHEHRVLKYALQLFNVMAEPHRLGRKKRNLLYYSALLHDIGYEISPQKHDFHTYRLIAEDPFFDFWPQPERLMLALVAGGHRKNICVDINHLPPTKRVVVRQLAAILRIADAIDYPRDQSLQILGVNLSDHWLEIFIQSTACATVSARVAQKSRLFNDVFGVVVKVVES